MRSCSSRQIYDTTHIFFSQGHFTSPASFAQPCHPPPSILFSITCPSPQVAHCFTPTSRALPTAHLVQHVWVDGGRLHFTPFLTSFYLWGWATCWDANNLLNNLSAEAGNSRWRTHHLKHSHKKNNYRHTNTVILDVCLSKDLEPYQWLCNVAIWDNGGLISCHFVCACVCFRYWDVLVHIHGYKRDMCLDISDKRSVGSLVSGEQRGLEFRLGLSSNSECLEIIAWNNCGKMAEIKYVS